MLMFLNGLIWGLMLAWVAPKMIRFTVANPAAVKRGLLTIGRLIFKR